MDVDTAILSKVDRGERKPAKVQIVRLSDILGLNKEQFLIQFLSDKIAYELIGEDVVNEVLKVAAEKVIYLRLIKNGQIR